MKNLRAYYAALLGLGIGFAIPVRAQTVVSVWACPSGVTDGQAFTTPTAAVSAQPCVGAGLVTPTTASFLATQTQASGYKEFWKLGANVAHYDNLWNGKYWQQASTVVIAPTPTPTPTPAPTPTPTPTPTPAPSAPVFNFTVTFQCANGSVPTVTPTVAGGVVTISGQMCPQ